MLPEEFLRWSTLNLFTAYWASAFEGQCTAAIAAAAATAVGVAAVVVTAVAVTTAASAADSKRVSARVKLLVQHSPKIVQ
jgi:hypothetical protein